MIDLEVWDAAKAVAYERLRSATQASAGLGTEVIVREEMLRRLQGQVSHKRSRTFPCAVILQGKL